ncbi:MAG TPA: HAMP domain-containing histidine kinase [Candidatus Dorea intestinavium]|nr:HAMP domain-containing histidine kinase [Candidatus Dorea intestinavium]
MKHSIKRQMIGIFAGLVTVILVVVILINIGFLRPYYAFKKEADFDRLYSRMNIIGQDYATDETKRKALLKVAEKMNVSFLVFDIESATTSSNVAENNAKDLQDQLVGYLMGQTQKNVKVLKNHEKYQICQGQDPRNDTEYIEMWGYLDTGNPFLLRSPLESIKESAMISNSFLIFVGIFMIFICSFAVWLIANRLTKPIKELTILSDKMANLDFDAKYSGEAKNEIGELGQNFNRMSDKLQTTISELKQANNDLQKDIDIKEKEEERRNEFIGSVSHELKTPISLIQGYAEGLKEGICSDKKSHDMYCDVIIDEANKMNQMVRSLLALNELELGKENTNFGRFKLTELIENVLNSMDIMFKQKDIKLMYNPQKEISAWSDEYLIEQVFRNYMSNAINHAQNEKIIEVKIMEKEEKIMVSVFNTGTPIPKEDLTHIWETFYKVDKARTRAYGGNGIGLSIVKASMESLHQKYGVKNYDNGVEFWFEVDKK